MFKSYDKTQIGEFVSAIESDTLPGGEETLTVAALVRVRAGQLQIRPDVAPEASWIDFPRELIDHVQYIGKRNVNEVEYHWAVLQLRLPKSQQLAPIEKAGQFWKSKYCARCKNGHQENIEAYGDVDANIQAGAMCYKHTGDPSFSLSNGSCG